MLSPQAVAVTAEPDGRGAPDASLGGRIWRYRTGASGYQGRCRRETGLSMLFGDGPQGYSPYETQVDGLPIWGMSAHTSRAEWLHRGLDHLH